MKRLFPKKKRKNSKKNIFHPISFVPIIQRFAEIIKILRNRCKLNRVIKKKKKALTKN